MKKGKLYVVATPIGNKADISQRAIDILRTVDAILAEDTRHSQILLKILGIETPLYAYHAHNQHQKADFWCQKLLSGESLALISDAGTPAIHDPGDALVQAALDAGISLSPIPGACALAAALSVSGFPGHRFVFEGFLPVKINEKRQRLQALSMETRTLVFYESPHRILNTVDCLLSELGEDRQAFMAREITKQFETLKQANLAELKVWLKADANQQKGEFVLVVSGFKGDTDTLKAKEAYRMADILSQALPLSQAVRLCHQITGFSKNRLYTYLETQKNEKLG